MNKKLFAAAAVGVAQLTGCAEDPATSSGGTVIATRVATPEGYTIGYSVPESATVTGSDGKKYTARMPNGNMFFTASKQTVTQETLASNTTPPPSTQQPVQTAKTSRETKPAHHHKKHPAHAASAPTDVAAATPPAPQAPVPQPQITTTTTITFEPVAEGTYSGERKAEIAQRWSNAVTGGIANTGIGVGQAALGIRYEPDRYSSTTTVSSNSANGGPAGNDAKVNSDNTLSGSTNTVIGDGVHDSNHDTDHDNNHNNETPAPAAAPLVKMSYRPQHDGRRYGQPNITTHFKTLAL